MGVSEWTAEQIRDGKALADELGISLVANQPQYSALWRVIEAEVVPACESLGIGQVVWSPSAIVGATRPEQVVDNVKAAGIKLDADLLAKIDEALLPVAITDPAKSAESTPRRRP